MTNSVDPDELAFEDILARLVPKYYRRGSYVNSPICPKIKIVRDFMVVLITSKSDEHSIEMKSLLSGQHFPKSMGPSRAGYSHASSRNWAKIELVRDFMPILVICKFDGFN